MRTSKSKTASSRVKASTAPHAVQGADGGAQATPLCWQAGLEEQCLGIVVQAEQPSLENTKNEVIQKIATNKAKVAKFAPVVSQMAQLTPKAAPLQAKLDSFFRRPT